MTPAAPGGIWSSWARASSRSSLIRSTRSCDVAISCTMAPSMACPRCAALPGCHEPVTQVEADAGCLDDAIGRAHQVVGTHDLVASHGQGPGETYEQVACQQVPSGLELAVQGVDARRSPSTSHGRGLPGRVAAVRQQFGGG